MSVERIRQAWSHDSNPKISIQRDWEFFPCVRRNSVYRPTPMSPQPKDAQRLRVNVRRPDVMELVSAEVARHFHSSVVERLRDRGGVVKVGHTTVRLAREFGFCYGVERAIDLAYASRRVFPESRIFLIGEIIHNPDVNRHLREMDIISLPWRELGAEHDTLGADDVVIVPAFGAPTTFMEFLDRKGCRIVDTTCGDVMKVWRRVRGYAKDGVTSVIHGKANHEETRATASRALGEDGSGHFLVVLTLEETERVCDYICHGGDRAAFLESFRGAHSPGFDPDLHLQHIGVANQTTMLKSETEEIQRRLRAAVERRDGSPDAFQMFDTICGATQDRQDALFGLLDTSLDLLLVVGGYNSSNTSHLVEIAEKRVPTFFIRNAECLKSFEEILHYDLHRESEVSSACQVLADEDREVVVGITAGASCPNNLIEETLLRVCAMRGIAEADLRAAL